MRDPAGTDRDDVRMWHSTYDGYLNLACCCDHVSVSHGYPCENDGSRVLDIYLRSHFAGTARVGIFRPLQQSRMIAAAAQSLAPDMALTHCVFQAKANAGGFQSKPNAHSTRKRTVGRTATTRDNHGALDDLVQGATNVKNKVIHASDQRGAAP